MSMSVMEPQFQYFREAAASRTRGVMIIKLKVNVPISSDERTVMANAIC